ncbi:MAG: LON peptidase substrate-binding domain-containing protein [bacterium]|nr:LON peptidase substrate-binding domain-containing protein [bacterium]
MKNYISLLTRKLIHKFSTLFVQHLVKLELPAMVSPASPKENELINRFSTTNNQRYMKARQLTLPMFPLNVVLFPGETTKLYIFEDRYKELVDDCLDNNASFGIPFVEKGKMQKFGCEVKINRILKTYENGGMDILVEGTGIFELLQFTETLKPKLYGAGLIEYLNSNQKIILSNLQDATVNYFGTVQNKLIDYDTVANLSVYSVASSLQLTTPEKYRLISSANQQIHLLNQLNFITHIITTEQHLKDRFIDN